MRCSNCGLDNPENVKTCAGCGTSLEAPASSTWTTTRCSECGTEVNPGVLLCTRCDQDRRQSIARQPAPSIPPNGKVFPAGNTRAVMMGAVMMLASLAYPWYAFRVRGGGSIGVDVTQLIWKTGDWEFAGLGSALTLLAMIVCASVIAMSTIYSVLRGMATVRLWIWLGGLASVFVIANALYILNRIHDVSGQWMNILNGGSVIAFVGALVVILGAATVRRAT